MSTKSNTRLRVLPVTLKEAALDSPTFRGTVIQCSEQVDHIEKWLDGYLRAASRLCDGAHGLGELVNVFIQKSIPVNHLEVMLDYDYTHLAMRRFAEGSREYWGHVTAVAKRLENSVVEPLSQLQRGELRNFKEIRRHLESSQAKYDTLQSRYAAQSKSKDPSSLREDAFQLYEARKIYMKSCFDFCVSAAIFRSSLDRTLTVVLTDQWREQNNLRNRGHAAMEKFNSEMTRVRVWSDTMEACERLLKKELVLQRRVIEGQLKKDSQPARDLDEYSVSTVPFLTSKDMTISKTQGSGKQGWLYMRSFTAKPTRAYWVRRWFFLKDGIFGYLMQGYRGGAVEESEKIGVLLCNVKAAFQEERRFCFEVKTKDTTILLQAETQADLTAWITTFEQAKRTAVNSSSIAVQASSIIPPSAPAPEVSAKDHFAAHDENISMGFDRALTLPLSGVPPEKGSNNVLGTRMTDGNSRGKDRSLPPTPTSAIGALMSATHTTFPVDLKFPGIPMSPLTPDFSTDPNIQGLIARSTLAPNTLAGAPSPSSLMKSAAMTAGLLHSDYNPPPLQKQIAQSKHKKTVSLDMDIAKERQKIQRPPTAPAISEDEIYPPNYPQQLRTQDTHFRALFPGEPVASPVLFVFLGTWHFTDKQEISGRFYVTRKILYFYAHSLGLVYKKVMPLNSIEEVRASLGTHTDHIVFHLRPKDPDESDYEDGVGDENALKIIINIFLEPVRLLQRRLDLLLKHESVEPNLKNTAEVLDKLVELESESEEHNAPDSDSWEEVSLGHGDGHEDSKKDLAESRPHGKIIKVPTVKDPPARLTFPAEPVTFVPPSMDKISLEREFDLPAKALFHAMFGDRSVVFQRLYQGRRAQSIYQGPWFSLDSGRMKRDLTYEIEHQDFLRRSRRTTVVDYQTIEVRNDHLCYVITDRKTPWHLPLKNQFMLITKLVITYVTKSKCKLSLWTAVEWSINPKFSKGMIQRQALDDLDTDAKLLVDVVEAQVRRLGSENRIRTAISLFGGIGENHEGGTDSGRNLDGDPSTHPNRQRVTQRSLVYMISENVVSIGKSTLSTVVMSLIAVLSTIFGIISAQRIILGLLAVSAGSNMMLSSRSTTAYWTERRASQFLDAAGVQPNKMMSRAVYLKDMEDLIKKGTELALMPSSECYSKFRELASQADYDSPTTYAVDGIGYKSASTRRTALNLMKTRLNLGTYRHDLLVALRLVNSMERNILQSEWENWLVDEALKCSQASFMLKEKLDEEDGEGIEAVARSVKDYCRSCEVERRQWVNGKQMMFE
ncbi:hypothetical protein BGX38DRAFT_1265089 [Terfezia claveryi]|nr:hypothetical protein BGX38DRAFT_1265089 [Terfezia claveryi]